MNNSLRNTHQKENFMENNFSYFQLFDKCKIHRRRMKKSVNSLEDYVLTIGLHTVLPSIPYFMACILGGCGIVPPHSPISIQRYRQSTDRGQPLNFNNTNHISHTVQRRGPCLIPHSFNSFWTTLHEYVL